MPREKTRIKFPTHTIHYSNLSSYNPAINKLDGLDFTLEAILRKNGTSHDTIRPIFLKLGFNNLANGSCYYETSGAKIYCSILGPGPFRNQSKSSSNEGIVNVKVTLAPFSQFGSRLSFEVLNNENELSSRLLTSILPVIRLETFGFSQVDIVVYVIYHEGSSQSLEKDIKYVTHSLFVPSLNAIMLSLSCSNIALRYFVIGASFLSFKEGRDLIFDPTNREIIEAIEQRQDTALIFIAYTLKQIDSTISISFILQSGSIQLEKIINPLKDYYLKSYHFFKENLKTFLKFPCD